MTNQQEFRQLYDALLAAQPNGNEVEIELKQIQNVCQTFTKLYENQSIIQEVNFSSKFYVIGDIHGQFSDVLTYFKTLGTPETTNYVQLGDLVDRGVQSVETVIFLFLSKILFPNNVFLLRGNHEVADQCLYSDYDNRFGDEIDERYEEQETVKNEFMRAFSYLPIAIIVNKEIVCVHGSIPSFIQSFDDLKKITLPLSDDILHSDVIQFFLWSDIVTECENDTEILYNGQTYYYCRNVKRNVGELTSESGLCNFLDNNKYQLLFRGHEAALDGMEMGLSKRIFTVFGATNYHKENVDPAVVFCVDGHNLNFEVFRSDVQ